jgi:phospholipid transport system substrate-binding protein
VAAEEPVEIVRNTTNEVISRGKAERESLRADPAKMNNLVAETIFPHFDFGIMSQWVLGKHWKDADEAVRKEFIEEFRKLLVRTYATALLEFSNQVITYPPVDNDARKNVALVRQEISQPGSDTLPIVYRLHNKDGEWKIFDVAVDGVSLVKTYRASFTSMIKNNGVSGLVQTLATKNQELVN